MRESEQEDFGPNSMTLKEFTEKHGYPSEHPRCPELSNLTPEENERFKKSWYNFIKNRKTE